MAQEWYLMNTNHDTVSGFETDDFENFARDGFEEANVSANRHLQSRTICLLQR